MAHCNGPLQWHGCPQVLNDLRHIHRAIFFERPGRGDGDPQRGDAVAAFDRGLFLFLKVIDEVLQLGDVGLAEPLHEPRHGVVSHAVFGHHHYRRLAQVTDFDRALRAQNLGADVIAVYAVARQVDHAQRAALESQVDDGVVYVADLGDFGISEHAAAGVSALDFAHHPSRDVDVVNAHVDDQAAAVIRIQIFQAGAERVARRRLEDDRLPDHAVFYLLLSGAKAAVESAHESHVKEDSGLVNDFLYRARLVERD